MIVEKQMECRLAGETEVLGKKNLPQRHFCPSQMVNLYSYRQSHISYPIFFIFIFSSGAIFRNSLILNN
jgi:hypothetical protein